ncbi:MAG: ABA4-like family protein [Wenzhouxiangellaceae bacterium]
MNPNQVFVLANNVMIVVWLLLLISLWMPRLRRWAFGAGHWIMPVPLGIAYCVYLIPAMLDSSGSFSSLESVAELFADNRLLLAGWLHYLAFDLFVGTWIVRTALDERLPRLWTAVCLPLTFLAGPLGLLLFVVSRAAATARRGKAET